ncbi:hypothetical protein, partial [Xylella fastidiosa]|uniref:hypothetical protein n=2 Tax=Xylella fastidiosa TaxID=2371 RepID=UPI001F2D41EC
MAAQRGASLFKHLQHHSPPLPVHDSGPIKNVIYIKNNAATASPHIVRRAWQPHPVANLISHIDLLASPSRHTTGPATAGPGNTTTDHILTQSNWRPT